VDSAQFLQSALLREAGFRHAFFTRRGGVSRGAYAQLNFSFAVGDEPSHVEENLRRAGLALSVAADRICFVSQVHGSDAVTLTAQTRREDVLRQEGDAVVARDGELACAVRTADCVPILLADSITGAVAAVHAGWRGTVKGIVAAAVRALGRPPASLLAAVGPHISREAFEVGADVAAELQAAVPGTPIVLHRGGGKPYVDLRRSIEAQLLGLGIPAGNIDHVMGCTYTDNERFFSFRRDGRHSGRLLSAIVPQPSGR
jgi:YfiH family protein